VIIDCYRDYHFGVILPDDILIQIGLYDTWLGQVDLLFLGNLGIGLNDVMAHRDAFIADIARNTPDQGFHLSFIASAERATQVLVFIQEILLGICCVSNVFILRLM